MTESRKKILLANGQKIIILSLCFVLVLAACVKLSQPRKEISFYSLEYDPPDWGDLPTISSVIRIERFSVTPLYNTNQIVYRDKSFKREAYFYHKWRANPGDLVPYFLGRDMKQSGLFKAVLPYNSRILAAYRLEGTVEEFFESSTSNSWEAVLTISVVLVAANERDKGKRILFQKIYKRREPYKQKNPRAMAKAMSRAMSEVSEGITRDIYDHLKTRR